MPEKVWTEEELRKVNDGLEGRGPEAALKWVADNFDRAEFALACSFADAVLVDMLVRIRDDARVFYLDTGHLFVETLKTVEKVEKRYGIKVERCSPRMTADEVERVYGAELWKRDPDKCCELLKVEPLRKVLSGLKVWITGIRRDESETRAKTPIAGWDGKFNLIKVNPLAPWTKKEVWDYICKNDVPYNELLDRGYPSIGCRPCTRPSGNGEGDRAGRWAGFEKTECGIHK
ncbi:MAG: phosphoadenylyl-sulfate reductase [Deltaproteobacteria bacterium]|nr:phosphoadenylyl-sulfate reductase [Deltaproteobacteria bacterium]